jgi:hypothetical protein
MLFFWIHHNIFELAFRQDFVSDGKSFDTMLPGFLSGLVIVALNNEHGARSRRPNMLNNLLRGPLRRAWRRSEQFDDPVCIQQSCFADNHAFAFL